MIISFMFQICPGVLSGEWSEMRTPKGTYSVSGNQWATYLRPKEVYDIATLAAANGLRGVALWSLDLDDWRGTCACGTYPLLKSIRESLYESTSKVRDVCN